MPAGDLGAGDSEDQVIDGDQDSSSNEDADNTEDGDVGEDTAALASLSDEVVPSADSESGVQPFVISPSPGCSYANPGTGTYAETLCGLNFEGFNTRTDFIESAYRVPGSQRTIDGVSYTDVQNCPITIDLGNDLLFVADIDVTGSPGVNDDGSSCNTNAASGYRFLESLALDGRERPRVSDLGKLGQDQGRVWPSPWFVDIL